MKVISLLLTLMISSEAFAVEIYNVGQLQIAFAEKDGFIVNRKCAKIGCMALKKARKFKDQQPSNDLLVGGKNPQAVKCKSLMEGEVVIALDGKGNEQSFCRFKDDSYLKH